MNALTIKPNVVGVNNESASYRINSFLEDMKEKKKNTYKNYIRYYKEFFMFSLNKNINEVTWEDIFSITYGKVEDFKRHLLKKGNSPNYVNQKLFACKTLWKKLYNYNRDVDLRVFDFEEEEVEENNFASLEAKEIELLLDFAKREKYKPLTKSMFFEFLYIVGCRKNVGLELNWEQITLKHDHKNNIDVWVVRYRDKGQWVEKAIHEDFHKKLIQLVESGESTGEKVFDVHKDTLESTFKKFQEEYNLFEKNGKKVCIHSIKKASGWLVQNAFGDLNKTRKHLQHKNIQLTASTYMGDENYAEQASYLIGKNVTVDFLKEMSKEEIIQLIEACGQDVITKLYYEHNNKN